MTIVDLTAVRPLIKLCLLAIVAMLVAACSSSNEQQPEIQLLDDQPVEVIVVTATPIVPTITPIPTLAAVVNTPTLPPPDTAIPPTPTLDPQRVEAATCEEDLFAIWQTAVDACLGAPKGHVCNGGLAPAAEPAAVSNALVPLGAKIALADIVSLQGAPIMATTNAAGAVFLHFSNDTTGVLIGDVLLKDTGNGDEPWLNFIVETGASQAQSLCPSAPPDTLILQNPFGRTVRLVVNGVPLDTIGTIAVQTEQDASGNRTVFTAIEGRGRIIVQGEARVIWAGQRVTVPYLADDWSAPSGLPSAVEPLNLEHIANLPTQLLERPVLLPQPGIARTEGGVNMRAEPSTDGELLRQVDAGETLSVLGRNSDGTWLHVRTENGETGWMFAELLRQEMGEITAIYEQTPVPPPRYGELGAYARVNAPTGANLREAPLADFEAITTLPHGTEVALLARSPYSPWVRVRAGDLTGWIALILLETQTGIEALPIDYNVPPPPPPTPIPIYGDNAFPDPNATP